jgi:hypothetical protein
VTDARRVRVVHPRTDAARRVPVRSTVREIDEQTLVGEIYIRSIIRSQARVALLVCGAAAVLLGGVAVLGAAWPGAGRMHVLGIPLPWLVLAVGVYPLMMALAWYTVYQAERNEDAFTNLTARR